MNFLFLFIVNIFFSSFVFASKQELFHLNIIGDIKFFIKIMPTTESEIKLDVLDAHKDELDIFIEKSIIYNGIDKTKYTLSLNQNEKINFFPTVNNQEKIIIIYVPFQSSIDITYEDPLRLEITNLYIKGSSTIFFQSPSLCIKKGSKNNTLEAPTDLSGKRIVIEGFYASITVIDFLTPLFICSFYQGCIYSIHSASNTAEVMLYFASDEQMFRFDSMPLEIRQIALVTCSYIIMNLKKKRDEFLERMSIPNTPRKGVINIPKTQLTLRLAKSKGSSFDFSYDIANKQIVIKNNHNKSEPKLPLIDVNAAKTIKITDGTKKGSGNPGVSLQYCIFEVIE